MVPSSVVGSEVNILSLRFAMMATGVGHSAAAACSAEPAQSIRRPGGGHLFKLGRAVLLQSLFTGGRQISTFPIRVCLQKESEAKEGSKGTPGIGGLLYSLHILHRYIVCGRSEVAERLATQALAGDVPALCPGHRPRRVDYALRPGPCLIARG